MIAGFMVAENENLPVPSGLKHWYELWIKEGKFPLHTLLDWLGMRDEELRRELRRRLKFYMAAIASLYTYYKHSK